MFKRALAAHEKEKAAGLLAEDSVGEAPERKKAKNQSVVQPVDLDRSTNGAHKRTAEDMRGERWRMPNHTAPAAPDFVLPEIAYGTNLDDVLSSSAPKPLQQPVNAIAHNPHFGTTYGSHRHEMLTEGPVVDGDWSNPRHPNREPEKAHEAQRKRKRGQNEHPPVILELSSDPPTPEATSPKYTTFQAGPPDSPPGVVNLVSSDDEEPSPDLLRNPAGHVQARTWRNYTTTSYGSDAKFSQSDSSLHVAPHAEPSDSAGSVFVTEQRSDPQQNVQAADIVAITEPELCKEQADLVDLIVSGRNVFYTGSAGCGKSTVLKAFVKRLRARGLQVDIVAPTGRAALDINGSTTWTYAGWTPNHHGRPLKTLKMAAHGKFVQKRLRATDVLVIDEISMVENLHFERLNEIMKEGRDSDLAFGGVQVVVTGDFCQLPPVKPFGHCIKCGKVLRANLARNEFTCPEDGAVYFLKDQFAFRSTAWKESNFVHVNLTNIHRQSDAVFINILQKCRMGKVLTQADQDLLLNHHSETRGAVRLFATREEVRRTNLEAFNRLPSRARLFTSIDTFKWNKEHRNLEFKTKQNEDGSLQALHDHRFDSTLRLKQGMNVVLLVNLDIGAGLVNGSQGVIQGFEAYDPQQLPKTIENASKVPAVSKEGVPMPPVPTLSGDHAAFREGQIKDFITKAGNKEWPIVQFNNGVRRTIYADCTVNELGDEQPHSLLCRTQIPLTAAWALSIHKSQGMTLNRVIVDLSKSFEEGQMYVALSRARSLDGLKVEGLGRGMKGGDEQVREFLREKFGIT